MILDFKFNWVLINQLAIGSKPFKIDHFEELKKNNINSILSLCSIDQSKQFDILSKGFKCHQLILPDHKDGRLPVAQEINSALCILSNLIKNNQPVFVHCYAGVERSPLICIAWLMKNKNLNLNEALEYVMSVNPGTSPLSAQLDVIRKI